MKVIFEHTGAGKEVSMRFAKEQKKKRKPGDPAIKALKAANASLAAAGATDRVHASIAIAEHDGEPPFKVDVSIIATAPASRDA